MIPEVAAVGEFWHGRCWEFCVHGSVNFACASQLRFRNLRRERIELDSHLTRQICLERAAKRASKMANIMLYIVSIMLHIDF